VKPPTAAPLLERGEELAKIDAALADARAGRGRFIVVEGPPGIGKTAVLSAARREAAAGDMRVLRSRGTELEREFAFGVVRQLFEPVLADVSPEERAMLLEGAAAGAAGLFGPRATDETDVAPRFAIDPSFAILHGLYWLCSNLSAAGPLCMVVDDAHWADAPSLRYFAFLITRLEELPVALIAAVRAREHGADPELVATVATDPSAEIVRLAPLSDAAVAELVESILGTRPDGLFVDACVRATRGTPLLLREVLQGIADEGIAPNAAGAVHVERIGAGSVARSIRLRLGRLPDRADRLARALAILEQSDLVNASRLAELDDDEAADAAELLVAAEIIEPGRPLTFVHPIVQSGVYSELSGAERADGHRRAARLLAELPGEDERVAQHLLAAPPAADQWVVERLVEAAHAARRQGARQAEARYLRRALEEPAPRELQPELFLDLGLAEASGGIDGWDDHLRRAIEAGPDPATAAVAARFLANALNRAQRFDEAVDVIDRAAASLGLDDRELALELEAAAVMIGMNRLVVSPSLEARGKALREQARNDPAAPVDVLATAAYVSVLENEPAEAGAELALLAAARMVAGDEAPISSVGLVARISMALVLAERYAEVVPFLDGAIAHASATGDGGLLAVALANRAAIARRLGDVRGAEADTRTALAATELPAPPLYRVMNAAEPVLNLVERGELDEAEKTLAPLEPEAEVTATLRFARGRLRIESGRIGDGLEDLLGAGELAARAGVSCPSFLPWRSDAALAHLALGEQEPAQRLAQHELELARSFGAPRTLGLAERAAGVVAGGERGALLLRSAIDSLERGGATLDRARALVDLGALLRRGNRRTEARVLLREALDVAHRAGARGVATQAETELRATGARPRRQIVSGVDALTASELRVAELAGQGLTNREIAQMLFVTPRTVEGHLTSVFRKLQLESRGELASVLGQRATVSTARG
jgi:DNA-binding CsgD family transcriptional regulator/tetratricopeptide (TPR) repeat protein